MGRSPGGENGRGGALLRAKLLFGMGTYGRFDRSDQGIPRAGQHRAGTVRLGTGNVAMQDRSMVEVAQLWFCSAQWPSPKESWLVQREVRSCCAVWISPWHLLFLTAAAARLLSS